MTQLKSAILIAFITVVVFFVAWILIAALELARIQHWPVHV
jgi:hypothetical protein